MNNFGILIPILALCIPIVAIVMKNWRDVRYRQMDLMERDGSSLSAEANAKVARLEQRVAVLERILTDKSSSIAAQIEELRS